VANITLFKRVSTYASNCPLKARLQITRPNETGYICREYGRLSSVSQLSEQQAHKNVDGLVTLCHRGTWIIADLKGESEHEQWKCAPTDSLPRATTMQLDCMPLV
jgi:hypothetical protein